MKLRNKETGEIAELDGGAFKLKMGVLEQSISSLEKLTEEWEDYKGQPYYMVFNGEIFPIGDEEFADSTIKSMQDIGNYFGDVGEAQLAAKKLKAWQRLKNAGFRFQGWNPPAKIEFSMEDIYPGYIEDMTLVFGGRE